MGLGAVGNMLRDKLGNQYFGLSEPHILIEVVQIVKVGDAAEQTANQDQQVGDMSMNKVAVYEQEEIIGDQKRADGCWGL